MRLFCALAACLVVLAFLAPALAQTDMDKAAVINRKRFEPDPRSAIPSSCYVITRSYHPANAVMRARRERERSLIDAIKLSGNVTHPANRLPAQIINTRAVTHNICP
jgi:hypothetical protein